MASRWAANFLPSLIRETPSVSRLRQLLLQTFVVSVVEFHGSEMAESWLPIGLPWKSASRSTPSREIGRVPGRPQVSMQRILQKSVVRLTPTLHT